MKESGVEVVNRKEKVIDLVADDVFLIFLTPQRIEINLVKVIELVARYFFLNYERVTIC